MQKLKLKLDKRTIVYLSCYIIVIVEVVLIIPLQIKRLSAVLAQIREVKKKIAQFTIDVASQDTFKAEKSRIIYDKLPNLTSKIIDSQDIFIVSAYISNKAKENGVEILAIEPRVAEEYKTTPQGQFFYRPIRIKAKARFHDFVQFLNVLERGDYFLEVRELKIHRGKQRHEIVMVIGALQKG